MRELTARILAVQRRQDASAVTALHYGPLRIDVAARESPRRVPLHLTTKEFDLLACMAAHPRQVFSRDDLLRRCGTRRPTGSQDSTVTEHIRRLRAKIEVDPLNPCILRTARGVGYRFDPPVAVAPDGGGPPGTASPAGSRSATGRSWRADDNMTTTSCRLTPGNVEVMVIAQNGK